MKEEDRGPDVTLFNKNYCDCWVSSIIEWVPCMSLYSLISCCPWRSLVCWTLQGLGHRIPKSLAMMNCSTKSFIVSYITENMLWFISCCLEHSCQRSQVFDTRGFWKLISWSFCFRVLTFIWWYMVRVLEGNKQPFASDITQLTTSLLKHIWLKDVENTRSHCAQCLLAPKTFYLIEQSLPSLAPRLFLKKCFEISWKIQ